MKGGITHGGDGMVLRRRAGVWGSGRLAEREEGKGSCGERQDVVRREWEAKRRRKYGVKTVIVMKKTGILYVVREWQVGQVER